jgi:hypothetical protein
MKHYIPNHVLETMYNIYHDEPLRLSWLYPKVAMSRRAKKGVLTPTDRSSLRLSDGHLNPVVLVAVVLLLLRSTSGSHVPGRFQTRQF